MTPKRVSWQGITLLAIFLTCLLSPTADTKKIRPSRNRVRDAAVVLNPYVSVEDYHMLRQYASADLLPLVRLVASEFKTIVLHVVDSKPDEAVALFRLPSTIAQYNVAIAPRLNVSRLSVWLYTSLSQNTTHPNATIDEFTFLQLLASSTKGIFPHTITSLSISLTMTDLGIDNLNGTIWQLRTMFPRPIWNLGLSFITEDFELEIINNAPNLTETLKAFSGALDHVVLSFSERNDNLFTNQPVKSVLTQHLEMAKDCRKFVEGLTNDSLSFVVKIGWPDTSPQGVINYDRPVEFWETMEGLAKGENFSVIFDNAFDQCYENDPRETTSGWWRLVENSWYLHPYAYVFETKKEVAVREAGLTLDSWIGRINKTVEFDQLLVSTKFDPYVLQANVDNRSSLNRSQIPGLISKIATQFQGLFVSHYDLDKHDGIARATIPKAVAKFNVNAKSPLRLLMSVDIEVKDSIGIIDLILKANRIYPGTITQVIMFGYFSKDSISELRRKLNPAGTNTAIKVGLYLPVDMCAGWGTRFLYPAGDPTPVILSWLDVVYFTYMPGEESQPSYVFGVDRVLSQVKTMFENCKKRVAHHAPELEVGFETGYSDSIKSLKDDYLSVAIFWGEMNDWAKRTNTSLVLSGAFDLPFRSEVGKMFGHLGWWKVLQDPKDQNKLTFLNKRLVALKKLQDGLPPPEESPTDFHTPFIAAFLMICGVGAIMCCFLINFRQKVVRARATYTRLMERARNSNIQTLTPADFSSTTSNHLRTGSNCLVYKCYMPQFEKVVVVKTPRPNDRSFEVNLISEIKAMRRVGQHDNILQLLGVCRQGTPYMVTEHCENGTLLAYLKTPTEKPNSELLQFCRQIASGMTFLAEQEVIHGDLNARNVLLTGDKICKISDLGLSRKTAEYSRYRDRDPTLSWRWMAYEVLTSTDFSLKSDVWSMGVTFWEIFSLGETPFPEGTWNDEFAYLLNNDQPQLEKPERADDNVYEIMKTCWHIDKERRPTAEHVKDMLGSLTESAC